MVPKNMHTSGIQNLVLLFEFFQICLKMLDVEILLGYQERD